MELSRTRFRQICFIILLGPLIIIIALMITWILSKTNSSVLSPERQGINSSENGWSKNQKFQIQQGLTVTSVSLSSDGSGFSQSINNLDTIHGNIEFSKLKQENFISRHFLWDVPKSSKMIMSGNGKVFVWFYISKSYNTAEFCFYSPSPFQYTKKLVGVMNDKFEVQTAAISYKGFELVVGVNDRQGTRSEGGEFSRVYHFEELSLLVKSYDLNSNDGFESIKSVAISEKGDIVAIGCNNDSSSASPQQGRVRVYKYNHKSSSWNLDGDLSTKDRYDGFGNAVDLSSDGKILAVGASKYGNSTHKNIGKCYLYQFSKNNNSWNEIESNIIGQSLDEGLGSIIKLSGNGSRLFASAAMKVYAFDFINNYEWVRSAIFNAKLGISSISTTFTGQRLAIGLYDITEIFDAGY